MPGKGVYAKLAKHMRDLSKDYQEKGELGELLQCIFKLSFKALTNQKARR